MLDRNLLRNAIDYWQIKFLEEEMFDTRKIGMKIAALRKAKDMTQLELADKMMVSYQAVSNWERGNSLPDISKLVELSQILEVSIEELLDSEQEAKIVEKIIHTPDEVALKEAARVAVMMKPAELDEVIDKKQIEELDSETLIDLAPFVSTEKLLELIDRAKVEEMQTFVALAPFLDSEALKNLLLKQENLQGDSSMLTALAPFLDSADIVEVLQQNPDLDGGIGSLAGLAPFLEDTDLETILENLPEDQILSDELVGIAPFLSDKLVSRLGRRALDLGKRGLFRALLPFMDDSEF